MGTPAVAVLERFKPPGRDRAIPTSRARDRTSHRCDRVGVTTEAHGEPHRGLAEACAELRLPLHRFAWRPEMQRAGLWRAALYLVRPDGYVALAERHADPRRLRDYWSAAGLGCPLRHAGG